MLKKYCALMLSFFIVFSLAACGNVQNGVVGTWVVTSYENEESEFSPDQIGELYGETAQLYNKYSLIFTASGNLTTIIPNFQDGSTHESKATYTVQDGYIEVLYDPDDHSKYELVDYYDGKIRIEITSGLMAIFEKQ